MLIDLTVSGVNFIQPNNTVMFETANTCVKGAAKSYFTHYSSVVIILFKRVYVGLHFLPILLEN